MPQALGYYLFFTLLGFFAFDLYSFKAIFPGSFTWKKLLGFEDSPSPDAFYTLARTAVLGGIGKVLAQGGVIVITQILVSSFSQWFA